MKKTKKVLAKVFASSYTKQVAKSGGQILHRKTSGTATGFGDFGFGNSKNLLKIAAKNFLKKFLTKRSAGANIYKLTRTGHKDIENYIVQRFCKVQNLITIVKIDICEGTRTILKIQSNSSATRLE